MATREAFEITQRRIGIMFELLLDYMSDDLAKGQQNNWRVLISSILGSVDQLHLVTFPLVYPGSHPLHLDGQFDENVELGFINAALDAPAKDSHIWPSGEFDPDWAYTPAGTENYPAWNGYPTVNDLLPDYPVSGSRIPVFMRGMFVTASSKTGSGSISHTTKFDLVVPRAFTESSRTDLRDIRVYRFDSTDDNVPQLPIAEVPRSLNSTTSTITVQVGISSGQTIEEGVNTYYLVFWNSPDDTVATAPTAATGTDVTASLNLTQRLPRDLFDANRYDLVDFEDTQTSHFLKAHNHTQLNLIDGSPDGYDTKDPEFYRLPPLHGSLDPDFETDDPMAGMGGAMWGYGYSLDSGDADPSPEWVYGVTISLEVSVASVSWVVRRGPDTPPEFWPLLWEDFAYHPKGGPNEIPLAKAIVKRVGYSKESAYRPNTSVVHLEYYPSYGRDHSRDLEVLDSLIPIMAKNLILSDVVGEMADRMLFPLVAMTPSLEGFHGGVVGSMVSTLFSPTAPGRFNAYWKNPPEDPEIKPAYDDLSEYMQEMLDNYPAQMDFHENVCSMVAAYTSFQPSTVLASFNPDAEDLTSEFGTTCRSERKLAYPTTLEIALPKKRTCHDRIQRDRLGRDYSVKLIMRNPRLDRVTKEMYLSASTKWISDKQAATMLAAGIPRDPYLWPSKLAQNPTWASYGRAVLIPDAMGGESHPLLMKPFDARDTSLPLYDEFVANLEALGYSEEQILDAVTDQEYLHGGFDTVDYRTLPAEMISLDEMLLGVTMYNETGIPIWKTSLEVFGEETPLRYGFRVGGSWYHQDFDKAACTLERNSYVVTHDGLGEDAKHQTVDAGTPNDEFALDGTNLQLATSFSADFAEMSPKVTTVALKLRAVGLPTANLAVTINEMLGGGTPGTVLQTSEWIPYSSLPLDFGWVEFSFELPADLSPTSRYLICLYADDPNSVLDANNRVEWAYANLDAHSYGITPINSGLLEAASIGDTELSVSDASVFSTAPIYVLIDDEISLVTGIEGNVLALDSALTAEHAASTKVFEVTYEASDSEKRWVYKNLTGEALVWTAPTSNQNYDATYRIDVVVPPAEQVTTVPVEEWSGDDITASLDSLDTIYISTTGDAYDETLENSIYGTLGGLSPLATFNGQGTYDFPGLNTFRSSGTNVIDGFVAWTSSRLATPSTLSVFPSAKSDSGVSYIPTAHDMYLTVGCVRWDGTVEIVKKYIAAGTNSPTLLDADAFVGISFMWVQQDEFASDDTYGFGAGETFVVRSR